MGTNPNERTVKMSTIDSLTNRRVRGLSAPVRIFAYVVDVDAHSMAIDRPTHPITMDLDFRSVPNRGNVSVFVYIILRFIIT
jgi:hypothetical protein